jgi:hypothetical protein
MPIAAAETLSDQQTRPNTRMDEAESRSALELELEEEEDDGSEYDEIGSDNHRSRGANLDSDSDGAFTRSARKRRTTRSFSEDDRAIVAQAVLDLAQSDDQSGLSSLWRDLAEQVRILYNFVVS